MASLYYTVFTGAGKVANNPVEHNKLTFSTEASVEVGSSLSAARKYLVRIVVDADGFVLIGDDPTAANDGTSGWWMGADNPEYFGIEAGQSISAIAE